MEYAYLEREYDELQKEYDTLLDENNKLKSDYDDLDSELNAMKNCVDQLVESKVVTLLGKMGSFNNYYTDYSSVEECDDLLYRLADDIEEYYNNMSMSITEIVETDALGIDVLLTFYSYTSSYNIQEWLKKIIIEEFISSIKRHHRSIFIIHLDKDQRKTLRDILINGKFVVTNKFYFPIKQKHVSTILKLTCTNFSTESVYTHNKEYFNKERIESLDIDQELKEKIMFRYKKTF